MQARAGEDRRPVAALPVSLGPVTPGSPRTAIRGESLAGNPATATPADSAWE
jgi:hypothetical protein